MIKRIMTDLHTFTDTSWPCTSISVEWLTDVCVAGNLGKQKWHVTCDCAAIGIQATSLQFMTQNQK